MERKTVRTIHPDGIGVKKENQLLGNQVVVYRYRRVVPDKKRFVKTAEIYLNRKLPPEFNLTCPKCQHNRFYGKQICANRVLVDSRGQFLEDAEVTPLNDVAGPFECEKCGTLIQIEDEYWD